MNIASTFSRQKYAFPDYYKLISCPPAYGIGFCPKRGPVFVLGFRPKFPDSFIGLASCNFFDNGLMYTINIRCWHGKTTL